MRYSTLIDRVLSIAAIVSAILWFICQSTLLSWLLYIFSLVYLCLGWILLKRSGGKKFEFSWFLAGYSFSTVLFALPFQTVNEWFSQSMMIVGIILLIITLALFLIPAKKRLMSGVTELIIRVIIFMILDIAGLILM